MALPPIILAERIRRHASLPFPVLLRRLRPFSPLPWSLRDRVCNFPARRIQPVFLGTFPARRRAVACSVQVLHKTRWASSRLLVERVRVQAQRGHGMFSHISPVKWSQRSDAADKTCRFIHSHKLTLLLVVRTFSAAKVRRPAGALRHHDGTSATVEWFGA